MKKNLFKSAYFVVAVAALVFASCSDSSGDGDKVIWSGDSSMQGILSSAITLDAGIEYVVTGPFVIADGGKLTIPAGMTIKASAGFDSYILVARGGQIFANGTPTAPITFTCSDPTERWGGLVINGYAPISGDSDSGNEGETEINSAFEYGGTNAGDDSGSLTYVKLLNTGASSGGSNVEHNGLTLNGVGSGTTIENIFVLNSLDDAIEFFGGSVDVKNLLAVNSDDDMFDFTQGYTGTLTNCYGVWESDYQSSEGDPRGVEADGNFDGLATDTDKNQSDFSIVNMTIENNCTTTFIEDGATVNFYMHDAIKLRRGAKATMSNVLVKGAGYVNDLIDLTDGKGEAAAGSVINVTNSMTNQPLDNEVKKEDGISYNVTVAAGNTGCDASLFGWTGYTL